MGWVSWPLYIFMFLASFSVLWWPNIWPKMGFPELFEKTLGSIQCFPEEFPSVWHRTAKYKSLLDISGRGGYWSELGILSPFMGTACYAWISSLQYHNSDLFRFSLKAGDRSWVQSGGPVTTESIVKFETWFELFEVFRKNLAPMTLAKMAAEFVRSQNPQWPPVAILEM